MARLATALLAATLLVCALAATAVHGEAWNRFNNPMVFENGVAFQYEPRRVPDSAQLADTPWSDTYWPSYASGIAHRWRRYPADDFKYTLNSLVDLRNLTADKLSDLSPAEKFDILARRYDYPTVHGEWQRTSPSNAGWEGLCHGWAPAAYLFLEPSPVNVTNADGIEIAWGASDVKAILTYLLAEYAGSSMSGDFIAQRCNADINYNTELANTPPCADINAGAWHVVLTNQLGLRNESFVIDRDRGAMVWNQPVSAYTRSPQASPEPPRNGSANGTVSTEFVSMTITWIAERSAEWEKMRPSMMTTNYQYWLELDAQNRIIGGEWKDFARPDFAWSSRFIDSPFQGYFAPMRDVYERSVRNSTANTTTTAAYKRTMSNHRALADPHRVTSPSARRLGSHARLTADAGKLFVPRAYAPRLRQSWSIAPAAGSQAAAIEIRFDTFGTERGRDKVRVYEGALGHGALLAVLHGSADEMFGAAGSRAEGQSAGARAQFDAARGTMTVAGVEPVLVVFEADETANAAEEHGLVATYRVIYDSLHAQ